MDRNKLISRMRGRGVKWEDVAYIMDISVSAAKMALKRAADIEELGEKPVIKNSKFEARVILKLKEFARNNPELSIRDLHGELGK